ncbi:condensation domain-containing protein [Actinoplanes sp. NPDC048791]|uniref:condensation domain-containing protein n=1 Tax=Actinoplanes sp. NPDC048791 TaxID=3154623 RepID=UPI0033E50ABE
MGFVGNATSERDTQLALSIAAISDICVRVLGVDSLGPDEDLFASGADSISLMLIVGRAQALGLPVDIEAAFRAPTVRSMALVGAVGADVPSAVADPEWKAESWVPLTGYQEFLIGFYPRLEAKVTNVALVLADEVVEDRLPSALKELVERHDCLSMSFEKTEDGWRQSLHEPRPPSLAVVDVADVNDCWKILSATRYSMLVDASPLIRATLYRSHAGPRLLHLVIHHLVTDAAGINFMLDDLESIIASKQGGPATTTTPGSFAAWCHWLDRLRGSEGQVALRQWTGYLRPDVPVAAPVDFDRAENRLESTRVDRFRLGRHDTARLRHLCTALPVLSLEGVILGALAHGHARVFTTSELRALVARSGRRPVPGGPDPSAIAGWLGYAFPTLLTVPAGDITEVGVAFDICTQLKSAPDDGFSYFLIDRETRESFPPPSLSFTYQGSMSAPIARTLISDVDPPEGWNSPMQGTRTVLFQAHANLIDDGVDVSIRYSEYHHKPETIRAWLEGAESFLRRLADHGHIDRLDPPLRAN